jgi:hypothetical protein
MKKEHEKGNKKTWGTDMIIKIYIKKYDKIILEKGKA